MIMMKLGSALALGATTGLIGMTTGAFIAVEMLTYSEQVMASIGRTVINSNQDSKYEIVRKMPEQPISNVKKIGFV